MKTKYFISLFIFAILCILYFINSTVGILVGIFGIVFILVILSSPDRDNLSEIRPEVVETEIYEEDDGRFEDVGRTCEVCGKSLRTRRKYCSECRPSGRSKPFELSKEDRRRQEEYEQYVREGEQLRDNWFG